MKKLMVAMLVLGLSLVGCSSVYYSFWEKLGREKRDLLRSEVGAVKRQQEDNAEQFKDALTRLQEAYATPPSKLSSAYNKLKSEDENAQEAAKSLQKRVDRMNTIAHDLFEEWKAEADSFTNAEFKRKSREALHRSETRYEALSRSLEKSMQSLKPVLTRLHETTLFMKHNLNARSLGVMKQEGQEIQRGIDLLLKQVHESMQEADRFLLELEREDV